MKTKLTPILGFQPLEATFYVEILSIQCSQNKIIILMLIRNHFTVGRGIILKDPTGATVTAEKIVLTVVSVYQITNPAPGHWTLEISDDTTGGHEYFVKSSSNTNIDFKHYFMIPLGRGRRKAVLPFANPITGLYQVSTFLLTKLV